MQVTLDQMQDSVFLNQSMFNKEVLHTKIDKLFSSTNVL